MRAVNAMVVLAVAAWAAAGHSESSVAEIPRFHLCQDFVDAAALGHSDRAPEQWFVHVKLTPAGTSALAEFTQAHEGEVVQILVGSSLVVEARVQTIVDSGRIQSTARTKSAAEALAALLSSPPSTPCGVALPAA